MSSSRATEESRGCDKPMGEWRAEANPDRIQEDQVTPPWLTRIGQDQQRKTERLAKSKKELDAKANFVQPVSRGWRDNNLTSFLDEGGNRRQSRRLQVITKETGVRIIEDLNLQNADKRNQTRWLTNPLRHICDHR